jgi:hypothetical protein
MEVKRIRARSAIVVVGVDALNRALVLHTWADRCTASVLMERIFTVAELWRPRVFGCEDNAMQALFADLVASRAVERDITLPLIGVTQPTNVDKDWRIRTTLQPVIAEGRLLIQPHQVELRAELTSFPMARLKDLIDALASALKLIRHVPFQKQRDHERESLAKYLRDSGVAPAAIDARMRDYDAEVPA